MAEDDTKSVTHYKRRCSSVEYESDKHRRCGCGHETWRVVAAEVVGTALLVLLTCLTGCSFGATVLHRALASGLVVAIIVQCFGHISGAHLNPTITLASVVVGHVRATRAAAIVAAQLLGAMLGGAALRLLAPDPLPENICVTLPREDLSLYKAVLIEAVISGTLALANCASWDSRNRYLLDSWPLRIGLLVAGMSLVAGELTGASMNPVRSFAPALWNWTWRSHWVYWAGPLAGAAVCAGAYRGVWRAPRAARPRADPAPPPSC